MILGNWVMGLRKIEKNLKRLNHCRMSLSSLSLAELIVLQQLLNLEKVMKTYLLVGSGFGAKIRLFLNFYTFYLFIFHLMICEQVLFLSLFRVPIVPASFGEHSLRKQ